jgi:tRNA (guanosine-2'-O-)-methyltransferase
MRTLADHQISIPMVGFTESFNVSVSVALTLQALRKRMEDSNLNWLLTSDEAIDVKIKWCQKYMRNGDVVRKELEQRLLNQQF